MEWKAWGIGVAVTVVCAFVLRMAKTQRWAQKAQFAGVNIGKAFSVLLLRWLPPVAAEKAEEGPIITALELAKGLLDGIEIGLLSDNKRKLEKKGGKGMKVGLIIIGLLALVGCSKKNTTIETIPEKPAPVIEQTAEPTGGITFGDAVFSEEKPEAVTVYFPFDSDRLEPQEALKLDPFRGRPCIIDAHACSWGTDEYNLALSERRGGTVNAQIGGNGEVNAWGETQCTATCKDINEQECQDCRKVTVRAK